MFEYTTLKQRIIAHNINLTTPEARPSRWFVVAEAGTVTVSCAVGGAITALALFL